MMELLPGGSLIKYLMDTVITPSLEKRRQRWFEKLAEAMEVLQEQVNNFSVPVLLENEEFTTLFIHSTNVALKTHQQEKLEQLKNAFINMVKLDMDFEEKMRFIRAIDEFQLIHMKLLEQIEKNNFSNRSYLELKDMALKQLFSNNYSLFYGTYNDLLLYGFIENDSNKSLKIEETDTVVLSKLGENFLTFIKE